MPAAQQPLSVVQAHVGRLNENWDAAVALEPDALEAAHQLAAQLVGQDDNLDAWHALGMLHMYRCWALIDGDWHDDGQVMAEAFARCFLAGTEVPPSMVQTAAMHAADTAREMQAQAFGSADPTLTGQVIALWQRIVQALSVDNPARASSLSCLSLAMMLRFQIAADPADLDAAVTIGCEAAQAAAQDDEDLPGILTSTGDLLVLRFTLSGRPADLDEAIGLFGRALAATPAGNADRAGNLASVSEAMRIRFDRDGDPADLDEAVRAGLAAVEESGAEEDQVRWLLIAGNALARRFELTGRTADGDAAIAAFRRLLDEAPGDDPSRGTYLTNLGAILRNRFEVSGDRFALAEAIAVGAQAVATCPLIISTSTWRSRTWVSGCWRGPSSPAIQPMPTRR